MRSYFRVTVIVTLLAPMATASAGAVVLRDRGASTGVAFMRHGSVPAGITAETSTAPCTDPCGPAGQVAAPSTSNAGGSNANNGGGGGTQPQIPVLRVRFALVPQSLQRALSSGVAVLVNTTEPVAGFASVWVPRSAANRAHIKAHSGRSVVIGRGTVSRIKTGTAVLRLRLSRALAAKLGQLLHVTLTVRLTLTAANGQHVAIDAAARY